MSCSSRRSIRTLNCEKWTGRGWVSSGGRSPRLESWGWGNQSHPHQLRGLDGRCELPQRVSTEPRLHAESIFCILEEPDGLALNFVNFRYKRTWGEFLPSPMVQYWRWTGGHDNNWGDFNPWQLKPWFYYVGLHTYVTFITTCNKTGGRCFYYYKRIWLLLCQLIIIYVIFLRRKLFWYVVLILLSAYSVVWVSILSWCIILVRQLLTFIFIYLLLDGKNLHIYFFLLTYLHIDGTV